MDSVLIRLDDKSSDFLEHHGVLGQKWGVRRYQNRDGTLTAEGRARYGLTDKKMNSSSNKVVGKAYAKALNKMDKDRAHAQFYYRDAVERRDNLLSRYDRRDNRRIGRGKEAIRTDRQQKKVAKYEKKAADAERTYMTGIKSMKKLIDDAAIMDIPINAKNKTRDATPLLQHIQNGMYYMMYANNEMPVAVIKTYSTAGMKFKYNKNARPGSKAYEQQMKRMSDQYSKWIDEAKNNKVHNATTILF